MENVYNKYIMKVSVLIYAAFGGGWMAQAKRIMVSLPDSLLQEVDGIVRHETGNRSAFIREAVRLLVEERRRRVKFQKYQAGFEKVGQLNRRLAEDGLQADCRDLEKYETYLDEEG
jgi:CopG family transcriptional regulator/antitoxin EndoAI